MRWRDSRRVKAAALAFNTLMPEIPIRLQKFSAARRQAAGALGQPLPAYGVVVPGVPYRQFIFSTGVGDSDWAGIIFSLDEVTGVTSYLDHRISTSVLRDETRVPKWMLRVILEQALELEFQLDQGELAVPNPETRQSIERMKYWIPLMEAKLIRT